MKKISTMLLIASLSGFVSAQERNSFSQSFNNSKQPAEAADEDPGGGGLGGGDDSVPIDDYIPVLAAAGVGMAVYFGRKKYILTK